MYKSTDVSTDGTEDGEIHWLTKGGVADDGRETMKRDTATLSLSASCCSARSGWCRPLCRYRIGRRGVGGERSNFRVNEIELSACFLACFCLLEIDSRDSFMCASATQILAASSIQERHLFCSTRLEVQWAVTNGEWRLIEQTRYV